MLNWWGVKFSPSPTTFSRWHLCLKLAAPAAELVAVAGASATNLRPESEFSTAISRREDHCASWWVVSTYLKHMLVKMGSSSPNNRADNSKIFKKPPPSYSKMFFPHELVPGLPPFLMTPCIPWHNIPWTKKHDLFRLKKSPSEKKTVKNSMTIHGELKKLWKKTSFHTFSDWKSPPTTLVSMPRCQQHTT